MDVKYFLTAYHSKPDSSGNVYWALLMRDADTDRAVYGTASGGESNIYGIKHGFSVIDEWDNSILFHSEEMPIRKFNAMIKGWQYAGCTCDDLTRFVKSGLCIE